MYYQQDPNRLEVYFETRKRRVLAGILEYLPNEERYLFTYGAGYLYFKSAIPVRKQCELTRWDVAMIFDIPELSVYKIEQGKLIDTSVYRLVLNYLSYPELALDQLMLTGKKVHRHTRTRVYRYFKSRDQSGMLE